MWRGGRGVLYGSSKVSVFQHNWDWEPEESLEEGIVGGGGRGGTHAMGFDAVENRTQPS